MSAANAEVAATNPFDYSDLVREPDGTLWFVGLPRTHTEVLRGVVEANPESVAVVDSTGTTVTYTELWERSALAAGGLASRGILPGDRVAIDMPDSIDWIVAFHAVLFAGAIAVPLDPRATESFRQRILDDSGARLVITGLTDLAGGEPFVHPVTFADTAEVLYTSGSTGAPKGVMIGQRAIASYGETTRRVLQLGPGEQFRQLVAIPLAHSAGLNAALLPTLQLGGTVILSASPSASAVMEAIERGGPDTMLAVPAIYSLLVLRESERLRAQTSLRNLLYGTAATPRSLVQSLRAAIPGVRLFNAYGSTEISGYALVLPDELAESHHGSLGFALPGVEVQLAGADGQGRGELALRGPSVAQGYWNSPGLTAEAFGDGWIRSGDIASASPDGMIYIHDRAKDIINRGGEKIASIEVEDVLCSVPGVLEVAVLPVADLVMGEKVGAVVVCRPGASVDSGILLEFARARLPRYAVPEYFEIRDEPLPRGSSGKVLKPVVRASLGWASLPE